MVQEGEEQSMGVEMTPAGTEVSQEHSAGQEKGIERMLDEAAPGNWMKKRKQRA